jgi:hypothetical protein
MRARQIERSTNAASDRRPAMADGKNLLADYRKE